MVYGERSKVCISLDACVDASIARPSKKNIYRKIEIKTLIFFIKFKNITENKIPAAIYTNKIILK